MAYGAMRAMRRLGLRVPEDVAVIGFDDHPTAELMDLSTVRQPVAEQALDVTTRLLAAIARRERRRRSTARTATSCCRPSSSSAAAPIRRDRARCTDRRC